MVTHINAMARQEQRPAVTEGNQRSEGSLLRRATKERGMEYFERSRIMNVIPLVKKRDWRYFDQQLAELNSKDVETVIARGRVLIEMKEELEHGSFEATVKRHMSTTTAKHLMMIARHPILSKRDHGHVLPASWRTLYELTKLPD